MKGKHINKEKLSTLREQLPYGAMTRIAKRQGITVSYVCRVLHGKAYDEGIIKDAIRLRNQHINKQKLLEEQI